MPWVGMRSISSMRLRISRAALLVNVTASIDQGEKSSARMSQAMRCTSTRVLPLPAPARTSMFWFSAATASRCASLSGERISETSIAAF